MSQKTLRVNDVLTNPRFLKMVEQFQKGKKSQHDALIETSSREYHESINARRSLIYQHIRLDTNQWKPFQTQVSTQPATAVFAIIIPNTVRVHEPTTSQWSDTQVIYTYQYSLLPTIELFALSNGRFCVPDGMHGAKHMVMEFPDLADFVSYLEEEMAEGRYPIHLSSHWK